jgi:peptide-methionine (S)-S-oxide reductase
MDDSSITIDANHPLAGKELTFDVEVTRIIPASRLQKATFGAGCFWGPELAFQRVPGVVQTAVGYSQGHAKNPSYQDVCSGTTGHAEVVQVVFDPSEVSYEQLLDVFWARHDPTTLNRQGGDVGTQYRSGIYCHTPEQKAAAEASKAAQNEKLGGQVVTEIEEINNFYVAEEFHQKYLERGGRFGQGQSAEKGCNDPIRCYG